MDLNIGTNTMKKIWEARVVGFEPRALCLARQALYHLSHASSPLKMRILKENKEVDINVLELSNGFLGTAS
jgi:hypothetical protein